MGCSRLQRERVARRRPFHENRLVQALVAGEKAGERLAGRPRGGRGCLVEIGRSGLIVKNIVGQKRLYLPLLTHDHENTRKTEG